MLRWKKPTGLWLEIWFLVSQLPVKANNGLTESVCWLVRVPGQDSETLSLPWPVFYTGVLCEISFEGSFYHLHIKCQGHHFMFEFQKSSRCIKRGMRKKTQVYVSANCSTENMETPVHARNRIGTWVLRSAKWQSLLVHIEATWKEKEEMSK